MAMNFFVMLGVLEITQIGQNNLQYDREPASRTPNLRNLSEREQRIRSVEVQFRDAMDSWHIDKDELETFKNSFNNILKTPDERAELVARLGGLDKVKAGFHKFLSSKRINDELAKMFGALSENEVDNKRNVSGLSTAKNLWGELNATMLYDTDKINEFRTAINNFKPYEKVDFLNFIGGKEKAIRKLEDTMGNNIAVKRDLRAIILGIDAGNQNNAAEDHNSSHGADASSGDGKSVANKSGQVSQNASIRQPKAFDTLNEITEGKTYFIPGDSGKAVQDYKKAMNAVLVLNGEKPLFDITTDKFTDSDRKHTKVAQKFLGMHPETGELVSGADLENFHLLQDGKPGTRTVRAALKFMEKLTDAQKATLAAASTDDKTKDGVVAYDKLKADGCMFLDAANIISVEKLRDITKTSGWTHKSGYSSDVGHKEEAAELGQSITKSVADTSVNAGNKVTEEDVKALMEKAKEFRSKNEDKAKTRKGIFLFSDAQLTAAGIDLTNFDAANTDQSVAAAVKIIAGLKDKNLAGEALFNEYFNN